MPLTHLLLDIEGTTCPVSFVAEVLFPFARQRLAAYLAENGHQSAVQALVADVRQLWQADQTAGARALLEQQTAAADAAALSVMPYLEWLIDHDIKATPLKDLQGRIWADGYRQGTLVAPLFNDVPAALRRWHGQGMTLAVYSSGSVPAQQLLYGHSQAGDLRDLFSHWFDTRTGPKQEAASYRAIAAAMGVEPEQILFISDARPELEAACQAGMAVLFSERPGNPSDDSGPFERIADYSALTFDHAAH